MNLLEQANRAISFALLGLIWIVQLVHYPAFQFIDRDRFQEFEDFHTRRISFIVAPLMILELLLAVLLLVGSSYSIGYIFLSIIVVLIWLSTIFLSVPCHKELAIDKNDVIIKRLIITNWFRTILWSIKGVVLCL